MKKQIISVALCLYSMTCVSAPASEESIRAMFKLMKAEALVDSIYTSIEPSVKQSIEQAIKGKTISEEQRRILDRAPQVLSQLLRSEFSWEKLEPTQVAIYREIFEQSEIDDLIKFYSSPTGQSFIAKTPLATARAMSAVQSSVQTLIPKIKLAMDELLLEAKITQQK